MAQAATECSFIARSMTRKASSRSSSQLQGTMDESDMGADLTNPPVSGAARAWPPRLKCSAVAGLPPAGAFVAAAPRRDAWHADLPDATQHGTASCGERVRVPLGRAAR